MDCCCSVNILTQRVVPDCRYYTFIATLHLSFSNYSVAGLYGVLDKNQPPIVHIRQLLLLRNYVRSWPALLYMRGNKWSCCDDALLFTARRCFVPLLFFRVYVSLSFSLPSFDCLLVKNKKKWKKIIINEWSPGHLSDARAYYFGIHGLLIL